MKTKSINYPSKFTVCLAAIVCCVLFSFPTTALGQTTVTFAQFLERAGGQDFAFTNNGGTSGNFTGNSAIFFIYQNISGLPAELQGIQSAQLVLSASTTAPATLSGSNISQPFNSGVSSLQMIRDTPASVGRNARRNLLTVVFAPLGTAPALNGADGGNSATFSVTTPDHVVTFSSDFLSFAGTTERNFALSFSSVTPGISRGAGNFLQNLTAAGSGTFASNPPPIYNVTTAAGAAVSGRVVNAAGRGVSGARVTLTAQNGENFSGVTNAFGYFRFTEVPVGESYTAEVSAKRYTFASQFITLTEELTNLNFTAQE